MNHSVAYRGQIYAVVSLYNDGDKNVLYNFPKFMGYLERCIILGFKVLMGQSHWLFGKVANQDRLLKTKIGPSYLSYIIFHFMVIEALLQWRHRIAPIRTDRPFYEK